MAKKEKRFLIESKNDFIGVITDKETGVQYLYAASTGITPLLDSAGKPIIAEKD